MTAVSYWLEVMREYGASVIAVAPADKDRVLALLAEAEAAGWLTHGEVVMLQQQIAVDDAIAGLDIVEFRDQQGVIRGRAKAP
jgi:hypothetical protein